MLKTILVGLDSTPFSDAAVQYALELAKQFSAKLTGIAVIHKSRLENVGPVPIGGNYYAKNLREFRVSETTQHIAKIVDTFSAICRADGVAFDVKRETGNPLDLMVSALRYHDLAVLGMRQAFNYGIIDEPKNLVCRLTAKGRQPILACPEKFRPIKRTLIVCDETTGSAVAMKKYLQYALWPNAEIRIIYFGSDTSKSKVFLSDSLNYCKLHGVAPQSECVRGGAKSNLLSQAKRWDADLIVMKNGGLHPLLAFFHDDATLHAIRHSDRMLFLA